MLYCSWDMVCDRCNYFSFWAIFLHFYPPNSPKNQNFKKVKKTTGDLVILQTCIKNHDCMLYCSWDMVRDKCNCYFLFWAIFPLPPPITAPKNKMKKKWKKKMPGDIIILHICTKNYNQMMYSSWDMVQDRRTGRQMDGQADRKSDI